MYDLGIAIYIFSLRIIALFNEKTRLLLHGQKQTFRILSEQINRMEKYIWFHADSLGEFENSRPLIEKIKKERPKYKILLTFSTSAAYETHKNYIGANIICHLPFDTVGNVRHFLNIVRPQMVVIAEKPLGVNYSFALSNNNTPAFIISAEFHAHQRYFHWYGMDYRDVLDCYTRIFVKNESSRMLLENHAINNALVTGDTRFDRVYEIFEQQKGLPLIERFVNQTESPNTRVVVAGNTWPEDENLLLNYFNHTPTLKKLIIVPHEMRPSRYKEILSKSERRTMLYSQALKSDVHTADCLVIDCFGILSSLYRYGDVAYVGGGFGSGVHNILEPSAHSIPIVFGPKHQHSQQVSDMVTTGACIAVQNATEFSQIMNALLSYGTYKQEVGEKAGRLVAENRGATERIFGELRGYLKLV